MNLADAEQKSRTITWDGREEDGAIFFELINYMKNSIILLDFKQLERNASVVSNSNNVQQKFLVWLTVHVVNGRLERDTCFGENYNDVAFFSYRLDG